jgi:hypothetical protein
MANYIVDASVVIEHLITGQYTAMLKHSSGKFCLLTA